MNQELLSYFQRELQFLSTDAVDFAKRHPASAGFVDPTAGPNTDPHVERFIDGFAAINADLQRKLDGSLPDVADALLQNMFPHFQRPLPSMGIAQLTPFSAGDAEVTIPAGTELTAEEHARGTCRFRTCYSVKPTPVRVTAASLSKPKPKRTRPDFASGAACELQLSLATVGGVPFPSMPELRFFLQGGSQTTFPLYEMLLQHSSGILFRAGSGDNAVSREEYREVQAVGFNRNEAALPWPPRSPDAARVLTEFFHFPQKFLFVDVPAWGHEFASASLDTIELFIYFNQRSETLEGQVSASTFQLNCSPIVNLFSQRTEPIRLSHDRTHYSVTADMRVDSAVEIMSLDQVTAVSSNEAVAVREFFAPPAREGDPESVKGPFWNGSRTLRSSSQTNVSISVVDPEARLMAPDTWVLDLKATCLNGDLPAKLPFRGNGPTLKTNTFPNILADCIVAPSVRRSPRLRDDSRWSVGSLLALQYLPLVDEQSRHRRLREILLLHNLNPSPEFTAMIDGLADADVADSFTEVFVENRRTFCRGSTVTVRIDESSYPGNSSYLFCRVLAEFLSRSCSFNSFCQLQVASLEKDSRLYSFPPASGEQILQSFDGHHHPPATTEYLRSSR